jgi:hypothetical protein
MVLLMALCNPLVALPAPRRIPALGTDRALATPIDPLAPASHGRLQTAPAAGFTVAHGLLSTFMAEDGGIEGLHAQGLETGKDGTCRFAASTASRRVELSAARAELKQRSRYTIPMRRSSSCRVTHACPAVRKCDGVGQRKSAARKALLWPSVRVLTSEVFSSGSLN